MLYICCMISSNKWEIEWAIFLGLMKEHLLDHHQNAGSVSEILGTSSKNPENCAKSQTCNCWFSCRFLQGGKNQFRIASSW